MKKTFKTLISAALIAACALTSTVPAYAHGHGHGSDHHSEEKHCGWTEIDGKTYYYNTDGTCKTKSCNIDGVRYCFDSDGVCQGTYTGWTKSGEKRYYYCDGLREYGWVNIEGRHRVVTNIYQMYYTGDWYYIDKKQGMLTGTHEIDGFTYTFKKNGKWDGDNNFTDKNGNRADNTTVVMRISQALSPSCYGGAVCIDGMCVVWSVDGKAEKQIKHWFPTANCVLYKQARYSMKELEDARKYFEADEAKGLWCGNYIDEEHNILVVESIPGELMDKLKAYIETLPCKDMIEVRAGNWVSLD